ncbi:nuclear pore complex protein NUP1-like isoform X2 [Tasmannia lanceolata]|uniref:nuclear pore complex protein NUP1-like isoform X2 n=1 Tax=Tasmannia lanceolata TaxID=3420 RepID=UPI004064774B
MATGSYEGGIGGKFRRRPLRRAPATPYDRPASGPHALKNPSWVSKIVDPASRIITGSASRLFSSVFRKRLPAPPPAVSGANLEPRHDLPEPRQDLPEPICINPSTGAQVGVGSEGDNPFNGSNGNGINELEQLLKQKTFTRSEFDRLTELLRSRTVDLFKDDEKKITDPSTSQPGTTCVGQEKTTISAPENEMGSCRLLGSISTPVVGLSIPEEVVASPAELAKAYMGTRPSKVSPSALGFRSQTFREDANMLNIVPFAPRSPNLSFAPRSVGRFSGASRIPGNGYMTPKPRGRSAIYGMACSPYLRVNPTTTLKAAEPTDDGYGAPSISSHRRHGKQVLKRMSSVLDNDFGSVSPMRRIRQKSNLMSTSRDINTSVRGSPLSIPLTPVRSGAVEGSMSPIQKPLLLDGPKSDASLLQASEGGDNRISSEGFASVPQSTEMARKILQHLDKLVASPKERSSEFELAIASEKSPTKLMRNMLHGRALKSMNDIESPKLENVQGSGTLDGPSHVLGSLNSISQKNGMVEENSSMKTADAGVSLGSKASREENAVVSVTGTISGMRPTDSVVFGFAPNPPQNKRGFQMSAPEDSLELNDDSNSSKTASIPPAEKEKVESSVFESKPVEAEAVSLEKPPVSSSENNSAGNFRSSKGGDMTTFNGPIVFEKAAGFTFAVTPAPGNPFLEPPTPTVQSSSLFYRSVLSKEQSGAPVFNFGSESVDKGPNFTFSPVSNSFSDTPGLKFGDKLDSKSEIPSSSTVVATSLAAPPEAPGAEKGDKTEKAGDSRGSLENAISSGVTSTTPKFFAFGVSSNSSLSNGSLPSTSSPSISTAAPTSPTTHTFKFGSGTSAAIALSNSISPPSATSGLEPTGSKPKTMQAPPFSLTGYSLPASATSSFTNTGSGIFGFSTSAPSNTTNSSSANNQSQNTTPVGATAGSLFGIQAAPAGSGITPFSQNTVSQFGSSTSSSTFGLTGSSFGSSTPGAKLFGSNSGGLSSSVSFSSGGSTPAVTTTRIFGSSSQLATSLAFGTGFGSTWGTGFSKFSFSSASAGSTSSAPFAFGSSLGSSSGSTFSFTSAAAATSSSSFSPAQPVFGMSNTVVGFGSASPGNDQMNVEDSMAEDMVQASLPVAPAFGQPPNSPSPSNFVFGSPVPSGGPSVFQFGGQQNQATPQSTSPFTPTGSLDFSLEGSFSIGTGGTDKSKRRIVRAKRVISSRKSS